MQSIRDLQLLFVGMLLANPEQFKEDGITPGDFADKAFAQLVACLQYESFGKTEKQSAIRDFIGSEFGISIEPETWREELIGLLRVNGEYGQLRNKMVELDYFDTDKKPGQLAFIRHFKHLASGINGQG